MPQSKRRTTENSSARTKVSVMLDAEALSFLTAHEGERPEASNRRAGRRSAAARVALHRFAEVCRVARPRLEPRVLKALVSGARPWHPLGRSTKAQLLATLLRNGQPAAAAVVRRLSPVQCIVLADLVDRRRARRPGPWR